MKGNFVLLEQQLSTMGCPHCMKANTPACALGFLSSHSNLLLYSCFHVSGWWRHTGVITLTYPSDCAKYFLLGNQDLVIMFLNNTSDLSNTRWMPRRLSLLFGDSWRNFFGGQRLGSSFPAGCGEESRARAIDQLLFGRAGLVNKGKGVKDMLHKIDN